MRKEFLVCKKVEGTRLDIALCKYLPDLSRRKIRSIVDIGGAYLNNKRVRISSRTVSAGDKIAVEYNLELLSKAKSKNKIDMTKEHLVYEDDYYLVINKPAGLPSQATRSQSVDHVIPFVKKYMIKQSPDYNGNNLTLVHRLDQETSGLLVIAKSTQYANALSLEFKKRAVKKTYHALCFGVAAQKNYKVENFLSSIDKNTGTVKPCGKQYGKDALTIFKVKESYQKPFKSVLIECFPKTGRSHQLRAHLKSINLPIVGDKKYCTTRIPHIEDEELKKAVLDHHLLHAFKLIFFHPYLKKNVELQAKYPKNLSTLLKALS